MIKNQQGITLTELLVTIAILSFAGILIWSVFFQGYNYSKAATSKNRLHQEANIVIANLTNIHRTSEYYKLTNSDCAITVEITNTNESETIKTMDFKDSGLCYEFTSSNTTLLPTGVKEINHDPFYDNLKIQINVYEKNNSDNRVDVDTVLYRLGDGGL